jgi:tripartite-type tricarboxylate transporter receptor subunit TctC
MPKISKRQFLLSSSALFASPLIASTTKYPNRPIRIVIGFQPGGTADVFARLIAAKAAPILGQAVVVDNKPGAGAILAADHVAKSAADGYTLFLSFSEALVSNTALYRNLPYKPERDFSFISMIAAGPLVIAVNNSVPANNLREFIAYAKSGVKINFGSWGQGSHGHLLCEALNRKYALNIEHVAYKGESPTIQDLLGQQIQMAAGSIGGMSPHIKSGALKAIGIIGKNSSTALPNVPTLFSQGATDAAFTTLGWVGLVGPANLPAEIIVRWNSVMRDILAMPDIRERFIGYGFEPRYLSSADFFKQWQADIPIWTKLVQDAGVTLD